MRRAAAMGSEPGPSTSRPFDAAPLSGVELLVVVAVWAFYAALNIVTGALDPIGGGPPGAHRAAEGVGQLVNPAVWVVLTTVVLWLSRRVPLDRAFWRRRGALVLVVGVLLANASDALSDVLVDALAFQPGGSRRFRPGLDNLTWLDDFGVFVAALAAGAARGWVLRERARREVARRRETELEANSARMQADAARLHAQLAEARLEALRRQLDPHFLFNTLNAVSALVERDPRGVRRMIGQLSDLLRHSMAGASAPEIPLRQELELLERYVGIMRVRFEDQLEIATRADPRALDALVPNMILQPLVENAIKHGVEPRAEGGRVEVEAELDGETLVLQVRDDGPGMAPWVAPALDASAPPTSGDRGGGVGLRNTAARLAQLYGTDHRLTVGPGPRGGTAAEVRLPYHTRADGLAEFGPAASGAALRGTALPGTALPGTALPGGAPDGGGARVV